MINIIPENHTGYVNKETFDNLIQTLGYVPENLKIQIYIPDNQVYIVDNEKIKEMMKPKMISFSMEAIGR